VGEHHGSEVSLVDPVGRGASGVVWRAWHRGEHRYVAAKRATGPTPTLQHPHVLTPYAVVRHRIGSLDLMPLVRGGTAERLLADHGALPTAYVAVLLDQLLDGLAALHAAGLVHRDVKPANLLLEPTGPGRPHLWLADLGVAAPIGAAGTVAGTTGYLGPEVVPGVPATPQQDLYAAGVTATELLTGHLPRCPRDVPRGALRAVLTALLEPDPADRPVTADDARRRLVVPAGAPAGPRSPVVPDRLRRLTWLERWHIQWGFRG
jgi:serine/threonine-protein kinase